MYHDFSSYPPIYDGFWFVWCCGNYNGIVVIKPSIYYWNMLNTGQVISSGQLVPDNVLLSDECWEGKLDEEPWNEQL